MPRLRDRYANEVVPELKKTLGVANALRVPKVEKIVVNMGIGLADRDVFKAHNEELARITGQKPVVTRARKSISNFKIREGLELGAKVTLRGDRMFEFLDRLISAALPRIRDFRGVSAGAFDGAGNYTLGVREQTIFPEIDPDSTNESQGLDVTIVTSTDSDDEAFELLKLLGMPFAEKKAAGEES